MEQEFIYYIHDNTETLEDHFTVTANDTDLRKHSAPWTVHVQITAVNDEPPAITANRVLRVRLLFINLFLWLRLAEVQVMRMFYGVWELCRDLDKRCWNLCTVLMFYFVCSDIPFVLYQPKKNRDEYTVVSETHETKLLVVHLKIIGFNFKRSLSHRSQSSDSQMGCSTCFRFLKTFQCHAFEL